MSTPPRTQKFTPPPAKTAQFAIFLRGRINRVRHANVRNGRKNGF